MRSGLLILAIAATALFASHVNGAVSSPFTRTELFYPDDQALFETVTVNTTFIPSTGTFTDSPADDTAIFSCGGAIACTAVTRSNAVVESILDSQTVLELGRVKKYYAPVLSNASHQAHAKTLAQVACPLGFETGRGIDLDPTTSNLETFGVFAGENRTQSFRACNQHRFGVYPFRFHAAGSLLGSKRNGVYIKTYAKNAKAVYLAGSMHTRLVTDGVTEAWIHPRDTDVVQLQFAKATTVPKSRDAYILANPTLAYTSIIDDGWYEIMLVGSSNTVDFSNHKMQIIIEYEPRSDQPFQFSEQEQIRLAEATVHATASQTAKCDAFDQASAVADQAIAGLLAIVDSPYDFTYNTIGVDLATQPNVTASVQYDIATTHRRTDWGVATTMLAAFDTNRSTRAAYYTATELGLITASKISPGAAMDDVVTYKASLAAELASLHCKISSVTPRLLRQLKDFRQLAVATVRDSSVVLGNATRYIASTFDLAADMDAFESLSVEYEAVRNAERFLVLAQKTVTDEATGNQVSGDSFETIALAQQYIQAAGAQIDSIEHLAETSRVKGMTTLYNNIVNLVLTSTNVTTSKRATAMLLPLIDFFNTTVAKRLAVSEYEYLIQNNLARDNLGQESSACQWCADVRAVSSTPQCSSSESTSVVAGTITGTTNVQVMGAASTYGIIAATPSITNSGPSEIFGNVAIHPAASITGSPIVHGTTHAADSTAAQVKGLAQAALLSLNAMTATSTIGPELGNTTVTPGVYHVLSPTLISIATGNLILNGAGVYVFKLDANLVVENGRQVILTNGAKACQVFWTVASGATLGTTSRFVGTLIAQTTVALNTGARVNGTVVSLTAAVTLLSNIISTTDACGTPSSSLTTCSGVCGSTAIGAAPTLTAPILAVLTAAGCPASIGSCSSSKTFLSVRTAMQDAIDALGATAASALTLRGRIDATIELQNQVQTTQLACEAAESDLERLQAIATDPYARRYFSQVPHLAATEIVHNQVYPYDPTTDLLPWHVAVASRLPVQKFGVFPAAVGSVANLGADPVAFVPTAKAAQNVYRIDIATFTTQGTFQTALAKLAADQAAANANVAFYNTIQLSPVYHLTTQPHSTDDTSPGAFGPVEIESGLDENACGACGLKEFVIGCHELGYTVLVETAEQELLLNSNAASAFFQADWVWKTVDLSLNEDETAFTVFPNRTFVQTGGYNGSYVLATASSPSIQRIAIRIHDFFLIDMQADGIVHQQFAHNIAPVQVCVARPSNLALVNVPSGQRCNSNNGVNVLKHYAGAMAILASGAWSTSFIVSAGTWPCVLRSAEKAYHVAGPRPTAYHTATGVSLVVGCTSGCLFETVEGGIEGVNDTRINFDFLAFNDPTVYEWNQLPLGLNPRTSHAPIPGFEIASDAPHAPYDYAVRYGGYHKKMRDPDWLREFSRVRLLSGNTPVFQQGFEVLNGGWTVTPIATGVVGTSLTGSISAVLQLRTTHPDFFNSNSTRRPVTPNRYVDVSGGLKTMLEKNINGQILPPGAALGMMAIAPPAVCAGATLDASDSLDAVCNQPLTVDADSDGMPDVYSATCMQSRIENYVSGARALLVPESDTDLVHVLSNSDSTALTITVNMRPDSKVVYLVGSSQQCESYNNDVNGLGVTVKTSVAHPLKTAVFAPRLKCKLAPHSILVFKMVRDYQIPAPAQLVLDGKEYYEVASLSPVMTGLLKNDSAPWTKICPVGFDWAANENCTTFLEQTDVTVVLGVRSGRESSAGIVGSAADSIPVLCPIHMRRNVATGLCTERRLGATSFGLSPKGSGPQGLMIQFYAPIVQASGSKIIGTVRSEFIRLALDLETVGGDSCRAKIKYADKILVKNMTRSGDYVVLFTNVVDTLLADIPDALKPYVRIEHRYVFEIQAIGGLVRTVNRRDPYAHAYTTERICIDDPCSTKPDPLSGAARLVADKASIWETSVLGNLYPGGISRDIEATRLHARLVYDAVWAADGTSPLYPDGLINNITRIIFEHIPQLSLRFPANNNMSTWRRQLPGSNVYALLKDNYLRNLSATDVLLTGFQSAHTSLVASAFAPFAFAADLNSVRLGENEWRRGAVASSIDGDETFELISEMPMGTDPACETFVYEDQVDTRLYGVPANGTNDWNWSLYASKRKGLEDSKLLSALEYSIAAKKLGKRVLMSVSLDNFALGSPLFRIFEQDPTSAVNPLAPPSDGGGVYFFGSTSAVGVTDDATILDPLGLRYSVSGCVSNQGSCEMRPRPNLASPIVQQLYLDQIRYLLDYLFVDGIVLDMSYSQDTDPRYNSQGNIATASIKVPGSAELVVKIKDLVTKGYTGVSYLSTDEAVSTPGYDWKFTASLQARKLKTLDMQGVGHEDRVLSSESSLQVIGDHDRVAGYVYPCIDCITALPLIAVSGAVVQLQGQEVLARTGTKLPGSGLALNPFDGFNRWTLKAEWTTNNVQSPPAVTSASAAANGTASNQLYKMQLLNALKRNAASGFSGNRISVFQNCTTVLSIRKWRGLEDAVQHPVYILMNSVVMPDTKRVLSWKVDPADAQKIFRIVYASGPHPGCADEIVMDEAGDTMSCILPAKTVVIYQSASAYVIESSEDVEKTEFLPMLEFSTAGTLVELPAAACDQAPIVPGEKDQSGVDAIDELAGDRKAIDTPVGLYVGAAVAGVVGVACMWQVVKKLRTPSGPSYTSV